MNLAKKYLAFYRFLRNESCMNHSSPRDTPWPITQDSSSTGGRLTGPSPATLSQCVSWPSTWNQCQEGGRGGGGEWEKFVRWSTFLPLSADDGLVGCNANSQHVGHKNVCLSKPKLPKTKSNKSQTNKTQNKPEANRTIKALFASNFQRKQQTGKWG